MPARQQREQLIRERLCFEAGAYYVPRLPIEGYDNRHFTAFNVVGTYVKTGQRFASKTYVLGTGMHAIEDFHKLLACWNRTDEWKYEQGAYDFTPRLLAFNDCGSMI